MFMTFFSLFKIVFQAHKYYKNVFMHRNLENGILLQFQRPKPLSHSPSVFLSKKMVFLMKMYAPTFSHGQNFPGRKQKFFFFFHFKKQDFIFNE